MDIVKRCQLYSSYHRKNRMPWSMCWLISLIARVIWFKSQQKHHVNRVKKHDNFQTWVWWNQGGHWAFPIKHLYAYLGLVSRSLLNDWELWYSRNLSSFKLLSFLFTVESKWNLTVFKQNSRSCPFWNRRRQSFEMFCW